MSKDYYKILGVGKSATKDDIKKAYRKLAHQYHPDKSGGDEDRFKEINEAYGVLGDDRKRAEYDTYGQYFSGARQAGGGFGGGQGFDFDFGGFGGAGGFQQGFEDFDIGDIFGEFFGGGGGTRTKRGRDIAIDAEITFAESVFGTGRKMVLSKNTTCAACSGSGAGKGSSEKNCATCNGRGKHQEMRRSILGSITTVRECETCHGTGKVPEILCKECKGVGIVKKADEVAIEIPPGIENGEMIKMTGGGEAIPGGITGDLYIKVHVKPHPAFKREGENLVMNVDVKLSDALLGAVYPIETLDGGIELKIPAGAHFGEVLRIKGRGIAIPRKGRGDLLIKLNIKTPNKLSKKAAELVHELKKEGI